MAYARHLKCCAPKGLVGSNPTLGTKGQSPRKETDPWCFGRGGIRTRGVRGDATGISPLEVIALSLSKGDQRAEVL